MFDNRNKRLTISA